MKKIIIWIVLIAIIVGAIVVIKNKPSVDVSTKEPIKIGADLALSGYGAAWAENDRDGATLAVEEINSNGGVLGRPLQLEIQDNSSTATGAVGAANKLVVQEGVKFILTGWAEHTVPILPLLSQNKALGLGVSTGDSSVAENNEWFYNVWPRDGFLSQASADYIHGKGFKRVGIFNTIGSWENSVVPIFKNQLVAYHVSVIDQESVDPSATDFKTQILKLKGAMPDVVYIQSLEPSAGNFIRQAHQLGLNVPFIYATSIDPSIIAAAGNTMTLEGLVFPIFKTPSDTFIQAFKAKFKREPGVSADTAYDAIYVLARAIKNAGTDDPEKVKAELAKIKDFPGASGPISFDETRNRGAADVIMMVYKNAVSVPVR